MGGYIETGFTILVSTVLDTNFRKNRVVFASCRNAWVRNPPAATLPPGATTGTRHVLVLVAAGRQYFAARPDSQHSTRETQQGALSHQPAHRAPRAAGTHGSDSMRAPSVPGLHQPATPLRVRQRVPIPARASPTDDRSRRAASGRKGRAGASPPPPLPSSPAPPSIAILGRPGRVTRDHAPLARN
jgi:hypothetical protein